MIPGKSVVFAPTSLTSEVMSVEMHHESLPEALPGGSIGFNVREIATSDIKRGSVVGDTKRDPPVELLSFTAQMIISNHHGKIRAGYQPVFDCHTAHIACKYDQLLQRIDRRHGKKVAEESEWIHKDDAAVIKVIPSTPLVCETFNEYPALGRFAVRNMKQTVAVGVIRAVERKAVDAGKKGGK
jgi:elongation factor 1-alpha